MVMRTAKALVAMSLVMALTVALGPPVVAGDVFGTIFVVGSAEVIPICRDRNMPGGSYLARDYHDWRKRLPPHQQSDITSMERFAYAAAHAKELAEVRKQMRKVGDAELRAECRKLSERFQTGARGQDPAMASPRVTWLSFVSAMQSGNKRLATGFLVGSARESFESNFAVAEPQEMINWASDQRDLSAIGSNAGGDIKEFLAVTRSGQASSVTIRRYEKNWLIIAM